MRATARRPSSPTARSPTTPDPDFNGSDAFTYSANDGTDTSAPATISITIDPVNDAPSFNKGPDQTVAENASTKTVTNWATAISEGRSR